MKRKLNTLFLLFLGGCQFLSAAQTMNILVKNIKPNPNGVIRIAFFADENSFNTERQLFDVTFEKGKVKNGELEVTIPIKAGRYGIAVMDDVNNTSKMEYKLLVIPKKGFGFSNFRLKALQKPCFDDFAFNVEKNEVKNVVVYMKYM